MIRAGFFTSKFTHEVSPINSQMTYLFQIPILNSISPWPGTKWPMLGAAFQDLLRFALLNHISPFLLLMSYWWTNVSLCRLVIYSLYRATIFLFAKQKHAGSLYLHNSQNGKESGNLLDLGPFSLPWPPWARCPAWLSVTKWQILSVTRRIINTPPSRSWFTIWTRKSPICVHFLSNWPALKIICSSCS